MSETIKLLFSGDFAPVGVFDNPDKVSDAAFKELTPWLTSSHLHITNLECPLTTSNSAIEKTGPGIKAGPENIAFLKKAGVDLACLANNHIFDFGEDGIADTINACEEQGMATAGIANRPDGKPENLMKEINGKKLGFLNFCEHEFSVREKGQTGASGYDPIMAFYALQELRKRVDYLIVIYHGGTEYYPLPSPRLQQDFRYLADLGADMVIGHHTHVYSGYELYHGKLLVYSLGNFFFPYENEPLTWHTGVLCQVTIGDTITCRFIPFRQCLDGYRIELLKGEEEGQVQGEIARLSDIINKGVLAGHWAKLVTEKQRGYLKQLPGIGFFHRVLLKLGLPFRVLVPKERLRVFYNLMRCQAHEEILKHSIKKELRNE